MDLTQSLQILDMTDWRLIVFDDRGRCVHVNTSAAEILGGPSDRILGNPVDDIVPENARTAWRRAIESVAETGAPTVFRDSRFGAETTARPVFDGPKVSHVAVLGNPTRPARPQGDEPDWPVAFQTLPVSVYARDSEGRFTKVNDAFCRRAGLSAERIVGKRIADLTSFGSAAEAGRVDRDVLAHGAARISEVEWILPDGEVGTDIETVFPLLDGEGRIAGVVGVGIDITRRKVIEGSLRQRETVLRAVVDNSPSAINLKDLDGHFLVVNTEFTRWHGAERIEGSSVYEIYDKNVADRLTEIDRDVAATCRTYDFEVEVPCADGRRLTAWVQKFPVCNDEGVPIAVGAIATDISSRKTMEESLRKSEAQFRAVFEESSIGMATSSPEGRYLSVNPAFCTMLGYRKEELIGKHFTEITHPDDLDFGIDHHNRYQKGNRVSNILEKRYVRKDGAVIWALVTISGVRDSQGKEIFGIRQIQDISDRKETEEWMRTLSLAIEQHPGGVWIADPDNVFEYVNPAFRRETGYSLGELVGRSPSALDPDGENSTRARDIGEGFSEGRLWRGEVWNRRKDGSTYLADVQVHPIVDADGAIIHMVGFSEDITERRELAERLRQSEKLEVIGQLTGGVAHDFNNILAVILTNAEILEERFERADNRRLPVSAISRAALRAAKLTERLLAFSRRQALHPEIINLRVVVDDMVDILRRTLGETIAVTTEYDPKIPRVSVDVGQLENAILNLAVNARDAMPSGGSLLLALNVEKAEINGGPETDFVCLSVTDTGSGMPADVRERIFEPFFTTKERGAGTGLGLSMVYGFVNQSGGDIRVESTVGEGTVFRILLPALSGFGSDIPSEKGGSEREEVPAIPHLTVLLVEDDQAVRSAGRHILESMGAKIIEAANAQSGLEALSANAGIDLLFTDVVMPGGFDGRWLAEKAQMLLPGLRVLFTSGYAEGRIDDDTLEDEHTGFIAKPYTREQLAQAIRRVMKFDS